MNELLAMLKLLPHAAGETSDPPLLHLQAMSTQPGAELLPKLMDAIDKASGWILHRQMISASMLQMRVETQGRGLIDVYAAFLEQGLDLSRESHQLLTERCSCAHLHQQSRSDIITLNLDVTLPAEAPLRNHWLQARAA